MLIISYGVPYEGAKEMLLAGEIDSNKFGADLFGLYLKPGGIL